MSKKGFQIAKIALLLVLAAALVPVSRKMIDYQKGKQDYQEAADLAGVTDAVWGREEDASDGISGTVSEDGDFEESLADTASDRAENRVLAGIDLEALQEVNQDVIGWIMIPGTQVSYPILQGTDNGYYLNHTWKKEQNSVGAIFMECQSASDFSGFHTILYGHRMRNGSMFGSLKEYNKLDYWREHSSVYIAEPGGVYEYRIFAAYEANVRGITFGLEFPDQERKEKLIQAGLDQSVIDTGIIPNAADQILTLSTCTGRGYGSRWVVQAVKMAP